MTPLLTDRIEVLILTLSDRPDHLMLIGAIPDVVGGGEVLHRGELSILYGFSFLYKEGVILPYLAYDDFQREYTGYAALRFLIEKGMRYPRGDVIGERVSTGKEEEYFLREIDLSDGIKILAILPDGESYLQIDKVICVGEGDGLPALLLHNARYLSADQCADLASHLDTN